MSTYAISLWQPWASLWVVSPRIKWHETRHWRAPRWLIGNRILVHAAKTPKGIRSAIDDPELDAICEERWGQEWDTALPRGGFVGSVVLASCWLMTETMAKTEADTICGNWSPDRYAWLGEDVRELAFDPARGQQGFWQVGERTLDGAP